MKIKAWQIQPGMMINAGGKSNKYWELVTAVRSRGKELEYAHFNVHDSYGGQMVGTLDRNQKVRVIAGKKKKVAVRLVLDDLFKNKWDIRNCIETVRLIQAMEN